MDLIIQQKSISSRSHQTDILPYLLEHRTTGTPMDNSVKPSHSEVQNFSPSSITISVLGN